MLLAVCFLCVLLVTFTWVMRPESPRPKTMTLHRPAVERQIPHDADRPPVPGDAYNAAHETAAR